MALGVNDGLGKTPSKAMEKNLDAALTLAEQEKIKVVLNGFSAPSDYGAGSAEFEAVFPRLAKNRRVTFVPLLLDGVFGVKEMNLPDGLHPNERGHAKIAETLFPVLANLLTQGN